MKFRYGWMQTSSRLHSSYWTSNLSVQAGVEIIGRIAYTTLLLLPLLKISYNIQSMVERQHDQTTDGKADKKNKFIGPYIQVQYRHVRVVHFLQFPEEYSFCISPGRITSLWRVWTRPCFLLVLIFPVNT